MSIHIALHHVTHYRYERPIALGPQVVRLRPAAHSRTRILSYSLKVQPQEHFINWQQDPQGNYLARLVFPEKTRELRIEVDLVAEMVVFNPFDFFLEPYAEKIPFAYSADEQRELSSFLEKLPLTPKFAAYLDGISREPLASIDFLVALNQRVHADISYLIRMEPGVQTPEQTLENASGSCRDSAWLLVQLLRHLGLAARFVSGYLIQLKADVQALDGRRAPRSISPICTPGARCTCQARAGSAWMRPRACWRAKGIFHWRAAPSLPRRHQSAGFWSRAKASSATACQCSGSGKRRGSPSPTAMSNGPKFWPLANRSITTCKKVMCA